MNKLPIPIEDWGVVESASNLGWRALEPGRRLVGNVSAHTELPCGLICTSPIVCVDEAAGMVETRNNVYRLGRCSGEYAIWLEREKPARAA
jgi:hypothetical protein